MEKYRNLYRVPSARAAWWDYTARGCYFLTICSAKHTCIFGTIGEEYTVQLSAIGKIVEEEWNKSFALREELFVDAFVIMPNHMHAILWIDPRPLAEQVPDGVSGAASSAGDGSVVSLPDQGQQERGGLLPARSVSSFVGGFKAAVTRRVNETRRGSGKRFMVWQPRFHDHIIRSYREYQYILKYIHENPLRWAEDKFYRACPTHL